MMLRENKITEVVAEKLMSWRYSGFNVHFGGGCRDRTMFCPYKSLNLWEFPKNDRAPPKRIAASFADCCADIDYGREAYCRDPVYDDDFREITMAS